MYTADFIVIGSGMAGLHFALRAAEKGTVIILTKKETVDASTNYAQGGIAAVLTKHDSFESHIADTLNVGCGLCDKAAVELMVKEGGKAIQDLLDLGVAFDKEEGKLALGREGGHSERRVIHAGDMTGKKIEHCLITHVKKHPNITLLEHAFGVDFIVEDKKCIGVTAVHKDTTQSFFGKAVILATGGVGELYLHTSNPTIATGDGIAMAYRAGVLLSDLEFVQFHPTTLCTEDSQQFLLSEALRGEGGKLVNHKGEQFIDELSTRDIVTRAIVSESQKGGVYLDLRGKEKEFLQKRFPMIYKRCFSLGFDMSTDLLPVSPAAHYICGGVKTTLNGETSLPGLFAFGEVACTGVHGANRLASNSLLESYVFSKSALQKVVACISDKKLITKDNLDVDILVNTTDDFNTLKKELRKCMWDKVGIIRDAISLRDALSLFDVLEVKVQKILSKEKSVPLLELSNMITVGKLIAQSALLREESRGTHYRNDFPVTKDEWKKHIIVEKDNS
jgi:L-aspartate oxidase